jgi:hypothetical protein
MKNKRRFNSPKTFSTLLRKIYRQTTFGRNKRGKKDYFTWTLHQIKKQNGSQTTTFKNAN